MFRFLYQKIEIDVKQKDFVCGSVSAVDAETLCGEWKCEKLPLLERTFSLSLSLSLSHTQEQNI